MHHSLSPFEPFLRWELDDTALYSINKLRKLAIKDGFIEADLTRFTETLIWHRYYHYFPDEGDGVDKGKVEPEIAWTGARWKGLFPLGKRTQKPKLLQRILKWVA